MGPLLVFPVFIGLINGLQPHVVNSMLQTSNYSETIAQSFYMSLFIEEYLKCLKLPVETPHARSKFANTSRHNN